ncbi:MAG: ATP-dependent helicase C-terminal domain-containing protein [Acidobacteriota bacterium]
MRFVTEGILTRRLVAERNLEDVGVVVLDEFHERHLQGDLGIALLRRLQDRARKDLRIVVMSATLDAQTVSAFLDAPCFQVPGSLYPVTIEHLAQADPRPLSDQVESAVRGVVSREHEGDILVFLPGAAEIRRAMTSCRKVAEAENLIVLPLHGDLSAGEQDRAVRKADRRKLILATNVAESSVTIDGVVAVIDSGLARVASHSPWTGLPALDTSRISRSAAKQRAGRAGRTRPGWCLRLYTNADYSVRPEFDKPEIAREDLAEAVLELSALGISEPARFEWFERPAEQSLLAAQSLLSRLAAIDHEGILTNVGKRMLKFPIHPRLARLIVECESRGIGEDGATLAALISEGDIAGASTFAGSRRFARAEHAGASDVLDRMDRFATAQRSRFDRETVREMSLDPAALESVDRVRRQLLRGIDRAVIGAHLTSVEREEAMLISILTAFPDRVARRIARADGGAKGNEEEPGVLLSTGGAARLSRSSIVRHEEFMVAVEAELRERAGSDRTRIVTIKLASTIKLEWLLDLFMDSVVEKDEVTWNRRLERVDVIRRLYYEELIVDEHELSQVSGEEVEKLLARMATEAGLENFGNQEENDEFAGRVDFAARTAPELGLVAPGVDDLQEALGALCRGRRSLLEVRKAAEKGGLKRELRRIVLSKTTSEGRRAFDAVAPERIRLSNGREVRVRYPLRGAPWIASRLQDFFGMRESPRIGDGRVSLVLHLLAPNQRPVQVTSDLGGFWERHYPGVRRELSRRYPRHMWPEDPLRRA